MATDTNPRMHAGNGLEGISIGPSEICLVDGENGQLIYRGHDAEVLVREHTFDEVAFLRFASVYRRFRDASQFLSEIENLIGRQ